MQAATPKIAIDPFSFKGVVIVSLIFGLANALVRLTAGSNLALDDTKENIFTQSLEWGYLPDNPPLYEWTLILVQQFAGPTLFSFLILKYALLTVTAAFLFLTGRRLFESEKWAAVTVFSTILLYQFGYNYHQAFTHSLMLIAVVAFSLWAFVRLAQERRLKDYLLFGLSIGLGMISKYNFAGYLAVLLIPALMDRDLRGLLVSPRILVSLAAAVTISLPHFLWLYGKQDLFIAYVATKLGNPDDSHISRVGEGIGNMVVAAVSFYLPFMIAGFVVFREAFKTAHLSMPPKENLMRALYRSTFVALALITMGIVLFGIANVTERYVIPFFLPGFFWVMWLMQQSSTPKQTARWLHVLAVSAGVILLIRFVGVFYAGAPVCDDCQRWRPYDALKDQIRESGIDESAIFIGYEEDTAGNLRRLLPKADVRSFNLLFYQPIKEPNEKSCYFVWSEELLGQPVEEKVKHITGGESTVQVTGQWQHPLKKTGWRETEWGISQVGSSSVLYNTLCTP